MKGSFSKTLTIIVFALCAIGIGALVLFPSRDSSADDTGEQQARVIIPRVPDFNTGETDEIFDFFFLEDGQTSKVPLGDSEVVVAVLTDYFDGGPVEKQFVAYRNLAASESPIYLTFIDYDMLFRSYTRLWTARTAAVLPGTVRLQTLDLLGDRSLCVMLFGMNSSGENTLTIFQRNPSTGRDQTAAFRRIFELSIDGTINIRETPRSFGYLSGQSQGESFAISAFGRDEESDNILDQVEIIYNYFPSVGEFRETGRTRIPGTQVEQRQVRELLGNPGQFEEFIAGLWHFVTPQGVVNSNQYVYFDPSNREVIFYSDGIQQIFSWRNYTSTRYGLHIFGQNLSIANLRRSIDVELESLETVRIRVREDIRLRFSAVNPWDGSYRKAGPPAQTYTQTPASGRIDSVYDSRLGRLKFSVDGSYEIDSYAGTSRGIYTFFHINGDEILELRTNGNREPEREVYLVEYEDDLVNLHPIRLGSRGIVRLHERPITLTPSE
ncbi:MAG: pallilysin-related adhesin [Treponema sp.]|nr:pallilysin-related adhesin [Treponema sp.]